MPAALPVQPVQVARAPTASGMVGPYAASMTCPVCGANVAAGARFCSSCGHALERRGDERRVATVLFADLVGFTTLSEQRDPEQVKNLVDSCFERLVEDINQFGGQIDKIVGDALLALFGAPIAHEDDAERAVRAALRMQETVSSYRDATGAGVQLRIGVNTGEVLVGSLRAGGDYTAMGDAVNIAQRLQVSARPGSVVVGRSTHAATRHVIGYRPLGAIAAKGREEPVEAWEALSTLLPPGYRPRRVQAPFVGRDRELGLLAHVIDGAAVRRRGQLVLLLGEAGVGKTRLAQEVADRARRTRGAVVYEGRCVPYGEANVWWPVAEALRQACGIAADDPLAVASQRGAEAVSAVLGVPADAAEVARIATGVLFLMGYEVALREIDVQRAREEATRAVIDFIDASASLHPVVLVLSDLHWADDVVFELLDVLVDRLSRSPIIVVGTARHELHERWRPPWGRHDGLVLNLDPLGPDAAAALLDALAESELAPEVRQQLLDRGGGNPFYLEELVALVSAADGTPSGPREGREATLDLPDTLRGLVAARIDGLSASERSTVEDAAVWGRTGPVAALERMAEAIRGGWVATVLEALVDQEILVVEGARWSFRSDLIREVAYSTLTKADRARRHYGIAAYLEQASPDRHEATERTVDVIAFHYAAAAELVEELGPVDQVPPDITSKALDWLEEAGRRAQVTQVLTVAQRLYAQAIALHGDVGDDPDQQARHVRLLLGRAQAQAGLRQLDGARYDLERAMALTRALGDRHAEAKALLVRGDVEQKAGELEQAATTLGEAEARFAELGDTGEMAEALRFRGMTYIFQGAHDDAERCISRALEAYRSLGDRRGEAWALQNLAWISYMGGQAGEAEERLTESADLFTTLGDVGGLGWALGLLAFVRFHQGRHAEAEELGARVLEQAHARGDRWGEGMMLVLMASVRLWSGRADRAVEPAGRARELFATVADAQGSAQAEVTYGRSLVTAGHVAEGLAVLSSATERLPQSLDRDGIRALVAAGLAGAATQIGDPALASEALAAAPAAWDARSIGWGERVAAHGLSLLQLGEVGAAIEQLVPVVSDLDGGTFPYGQSSLALACAAAGRRRDAEQLHEQVESAPRATYLDRAMSRLAVELARAGEGDRGAADGLAELIADLDGTDDRVAQAVARLAESMVLESFGVPTSELAAQLAEQRLEELGIMAEGWRTVFRVALGARDRAGT
jgi:class 3 adenylate cyclase/tetratricopeptide (TPR) repeat protein